MVFSQTQEMIMTKKDFELIANIIKNLDVEEGTPREMHRRYIARQFALALQHTNARFDVDKFVEACE
jgi:hypothetical protein